VATVPSSASRKTTQSLSSRRSSAAAGWACTNWADPSELYRPDSALPGRKRKQFSWISPRPLWDSRNDKIARRRWMGDPTDYERTRWLEAQRRKGVDPNVPVRRYADKDEVSFMVLGDPGEGDDSQYQVLRPLRATSQDTDFTYIVSDVIYPAGDTGDYLDKFLHPYRELPGPIYAVPGNHDWYDGLHGFMTLLCDADPDLRPPVHASRSRKKRALLDLVWREPSADVQRQLEELADHRREPSGQPAPYFALELKELLLVGIDTGIQSGIDAEQGEWLRKISTLPKDKILLTGKPLVVDASRKPCRIAGSRDTVNAVVDDPANRYIAVIGGDIHNYQRYPVGQPDERVIQHIVSGAAGAYTKATHNIPKATVETCGCKEDDFRCYPRRGDSLAAYSVLLNRWIPGYDIVIPPDVAPAVMGLRLDNVVDPTRVEDRGKRVPKDVWRKATVVFPISHASMLGPFNTYFSELLDWNKPPPPLFKSFLKVETRPGEIEIRCFAATGCEEHADDPPLEDWLRGRRVDDGHWDWEVLLD
jgi:Calcineurin-like phosphoesterase